MKQAAPSSSPLVALKDFDWRRLKRLTDQQTMKDLDQFLDNLPLRAGKNALIIASVMWFLAACALFLLYHNALSLKDIQKQLSLAEGNRVMVPQITYKPADQQILRPLIDKLKKIYPSLTFELQNESDITVKGLTTRDFPIWRSAIGDLANGSPGWKIGVKKFCAGQSCPDTPLSVTLVVQNVDIQVPEPPPEETTTENEKTPTKP